MSTYILNNASPEQQLVIDSISNGNNVILDCIAGSGKTTVALLVAKELKGKKILLLTYNKKLKLETQEKRDKLELTNLHVFSYHSFGVKNYSHKCHIDSGLIKVVEYDSEPAERFDYDLIILDESQDVTNLLYKFVRKIYSDSKTIPQIAIIGDKYQSIYKFRNADERFITMAEQLFNFNDLNFVDLKLSISYRVTRELANFLNDVVLNEKRITSYRDEPGHGRVIYATFNTFTGSKCKYYRQFIDIIVSNIKKHGESEIFILSPSLKSQKLPVRKLANKLSDMGYKIYVPLNDEQVIDDGAANDKILFSTFHQAKGLERKFVVVFEFSENYLKFYNRNANKDKCPNELYVALTRSKGDIMVIQHDKCRPLPFLDLNIIDNYVEYLNYDGFMKSRKLPDTSDEKLRIFELCITELVKYLPSETLKECTKYFKKSVIISEVVNDNQLIKYDGSYINIPMVIKQGKSVEVVAEINAVAIYTYYEAKKFGKASIIKILNEHNKEYTDFLVTKKLSDLLKLSNEFCAFDIGYNYKLNQIKEYNWLDKKHLIESYNRLDKTLYYNSNSSITFEHEVGHKVGDILLKGRIDVIGKINNDRHIYELKCVEKLVDRHFVELALYALLYNLEYPDNKNKYNLCYYIYNILGDEKYEIKFELSDLIKMGEYLVEKKLSSDVNISDDEFIINATSE